MRMFAKEVNVVVSNLKMDGVLVEAVRSQRYVRRWMAKLKVSITAARLQI
jgi:hypothetical protein